MCVPFPVFPKTQNRRARRWLLTGTIRKSPVRRINIDECPFAKHKDAVQKSPCRIAPTGAWRREVDGWQAGLSLVIHQRSARSKPTAPRILSFITPCIPADQSAGNRQQEKAAKRSKEGTLCDVERLSE
jgi:hypothetical protein